MPDTQVADVRELIDGLRRDRRRHPYSGRREYSQCARTVAAAVADMIEAGDAASAVPLARRAVERVTAALAYVDDSAGIVGDDLRTLMALYGRACQAAPPEAIKTIRRLRDAYQRVGDEAGFTAYQDSLRQRHRRKTSFITKLDKALLRS